MKLDFQMKRGDSRNVSFAAVRVDETVIPPEETPLNLTAAGLEIRFTAKKNEADALPFFRRTFGVVGGEGGIEVDTPSTPEQNRGVVKIAPANTASLTRDTDLLYELEIQESDDSTWTVLHGIIDVQLDLA